MAKKEKSFSDWLNERPVWQKISAKILIEQGTIPEDKIEEISSLCYKEANSEVGIEDCDIKAISEKISNSESSEFKILEITDIKGVNALNPKRPIRLHPHTLSILYGTNGSGKSGYVRALKHLSGNKKKGILIGNIYSDTKEEASISLKIDIGGKENIIQHQLDKPHPQFERVKIYDTQTSSLFIDEESEISYEPPELWFLSELTKVSEKISDVLKERREVVLKTDFQLPEYHSNTDIGSWFNSITTNTNEEELNSKIFWTESDDAKLAELIQLLSATDVSKKITTLSNQDLAAKTVTDVLNEILIGYSNDNLKSLKTLNEISKGSTKIAKEAAEKVFSSAPLSGVGNATWKALWESAREYSVTEAYKDKIFPFLADGSVCILCQQPLESEAKNRLADFENFIQGSLEKKASEDLLKYKQKLSELPKLPPDEVVALNLQILLPEEQDKQEEFLKEIINLRAKLDKINNGSTFDEIDFSKEKKIIEYLSTIKTKVLRELEEAKKSQNPEEKAEILKSKAELEARSFLFKNIQKIQERINSLKIVEEFDEAINSCNTTPLSKKKSALSASLLTDEFRDIFQKELNKLGAGHLKAELQQKRASKGVTYYAVKLKSNDEAPVGKILSEGEFRIASLAAFISEILLSKNKAPIIFDDPINSLDVEYEEYVSNRICEMSKNQQVIVFTHRISLLTNLETIAKSQDGEANTLHLTRENWGTGQPGETPVYARKVDTSLNLLIANLQKGKKILDTDGGTTAFYPVGKALCSDFRILLERVIEEYLLQSVVIRFRRSVQTLRLKNLLHIEKADIQLIDELMTKYSYFEHSQPIETPAPLPNVSEIEADFQKLKTWLDSFRKRVKN